MRSALGGTKLTAPVGLGLTLALITPAFADGGRGGGTGGSEVTGVSGGADSATGAGSEGGIGIDDWGVASGGGGGGAGVTGASGGHGKFVSSVAAGGAGGATAGANGGDGSNSIDGGNGGGGGGGGAHGAVVSISGALSGTGGNGGNGGDGPSSVGDLNHVGGGGGGGAGGYGAVGTGSGLSLISSGTVAGGNGGNGGVGGAGGGSPGGGGSGGTGLDLTGTSNSLVNTGTISGGTGGASGLNPAVNRWSQNGAAGLGGSGISGADLTIINSGTISGGLSGDGVTRANAVSFIGGINALELVAGTDILGNVIAFSAADTLRLGGTANSSFDMSQIGATTQYQGFGIFQKTGASIWTLTGTTAAVTPWTITDGALSIASDANLGAATGGLTFNGGSLAVTADIQMTRDVMLNGTGNFDVAVDSELGLMGVVSGAGDLHKAGWGTLRLVGTNSYGDTMVRDGTLVGDTASISGHIGNNATVVFDQTVDGTFAGNIVPFTAPGGVMVKQGAGDLTLTGSSALDWSIDAGGLVSAAERFGGNAYIAPGASLTFSQIGNGSYAGALSGAGAFSKSGTGTVVLTGDSSAFSGATTVSGGALVVGQGDTGALGGTLDVLAGSMLGGNGMLGGVTVAAGGTLAPGNSIGAITVASLSMAAGGVFEVEIDNGGFAKGINNDHTQVNGTATFADGAIIAVKSYPAGADGSSYAAGHYTILNAVTLDVQGDLVIDESFAFLDFTTGYSTTALWLDSYLIASTFCLAGSSANQCATGDAVFSLGSTSGLYQQLVGMSDAQALAAQNMLSGEIHASVKSALIEDSRFVRDAINDRIRAAFDGVGSAGLPLLAYGEDGPQLAPADTQRFAGWGSVFGAWGSIDGDGNAASLDRSTGGFLTGLDGLVTENVRLGVMAGYSQSSFQADARASSGSSDNYHLGLYGGTQIGALGFRSGLAYTWHKMSTSRSAAFAGQLEADYNTATTQAFGELGYRMDTASASFEPFANLAYVNLHTDGFTEKGGAAALTSASQTTDTTFTTLGIRASTGFDLGSVKANARGMIGWRHAFGDTLPTATHAFAGANAFTVTGVPIAEDAAIVEAGLDLALAPEATLAISYAGQIARNTQQHGFKANLGVRF